MIFKSTMLAMALSIACANAAEVTDRVVAIAAGNAVTWSGAAMEANWQAFLAGEPPVEAPLDRDDSFEKLRPVIERLADQSILETVRQRSPLATDPETGVEATPAVRWDALAQKYPSAEALRAELTKYGLSEEYARSRLAREQRIMTFVDYSLRPQIRVSGDDLAAYYRDEFVPEFRRQQAAAEPPLLDDVRYQIEEILVQRGMNQQVGLWLENLKKEQGLRVKLLGRTKEP